MRIWLLFPFLKISKPKHWKCKISSVAQTVFVRLISVKMDSKGFFIKNFNNHDDHQQKNFSQTALRQSLVLWFFLPY